MVLQEATIVHWPRSKSELRVFVHKITEQGAYRTQLLRLAVYKLKPATLRQYCTLDSAAIMLTICYDDTRLSMASLLRLRSTRTLSVDPFVSAGLLGIDEGESV